MTSGHINEVYIKPCALNPAQVMSVALKSYVAQVMSVALSRSQVMSVALKSLLLSHVCVSLSRSQTALKYEPEPIEIRRLARTWETDSRET